MPVALPPSQSKQPASSTVTRLAREAGPDLFVDLLAPQGSIPAQVSRLLPQPCRSLEHWHRYQHLDLPELTQDEQELERWRLFAAIADVEDPARVPAWIRERLRRLAAPSAASEGHRRSGRIAMDARA